MRQDPSVCVCVCGSGDFISESRLTLGTPWTVARQVPLSMGFPRQEYWSGLPFPSPGDLPDPRMESMSPAFQAGFLHKHTSVQLVQSLRCVRLFATPWTVAYQASQSIGFSRQEYWSGLPFPSPGDLPDPGIEPGSPALESDALTSEPPGKPLNTSIPVLTSEISREERKPG